MINVNEFLDDLRDRVDGELVNPVGIEEATNFPDQFYVERRTWKRIRDVVAVVADLKRSTNLSYNRQPETTARIYEAATGNMVRTVERFEPDFVDIQGDGLFALFHGHRRYERAMCAAITLKSFGINALEAALEDHLGAEAPKTGIKVGMASGTIIVKNVGVRGTNEPVWAGRPVNYATKCAQTADKQELIITPQVWEHFAENHWVAYSCGCGQADATPVELWDQITVDKLPEGAADCRRLKAGVAWCSTHGDKFCQSILDGLRMRKSVAAAAA